jgi:Flp pilus assembly protein TadD
MQAIGELIQAASRHFAEGDLPQTDAACLQILTQDPRHAHALHLLGVVRYRRGQLAEALVYLRLAARFDSTNAGLYSNLGMTHAALGQFTEAIAQYRESLRLNPHHAEAHNNLGIVLAGLGRFDEAIMHYRAALQLNAGDAAVHNNLAVVLLERGAVADAELHYREALRLKADYPAALNNLAALLIQRGLPGEAIACCRESLRLDPDTVAAYTQLGDLAAHGLYQFTDAELHRMEDLLQVGRLAPEHASQLHFILAAHRDRQGQLDQAFAHYRQANEWKREVFRQKNLAFDPTRHRHFIDELIATFDQAFFERVRSFGVDTEMPIFIVGMPRSGSTLVEQILSSHPQVVSGGELRDLAEIVSSPPTDGGPHYPVRLANLNGMTARTLAERYLARLSSLGEGAARVLDKMPHNYLHLGCIAALFPHARIIHCRRDPMDVCLSCYFQNFTWVNYKCSLEDLGFYYRQYERLMQHWREVLPSRICEVEYEELVRNQDQVSRRLVAFCGLDWDDRCLYFHENSRTVQTASKLQVRRPIYASSVYRWKRYESHLQPLKQVLAATSDLNADALAAFAQLYGAAHGRIQPLTKIEWPA